MNHQIARCAQQQLTTLIHMTGIMGVLTRVVEFIYEGLGCDVVCVARQYNVVTKPPGAVGGSHVGCDVLEHRGQGRHLHG